MRYTLDNIGTFFAGIDRSIPQTIELSDDILRDKLRWMVLWERIKSYRSTPIAVMLRGAYLTKYDANLWYEHNQAIAVHPNLTVDFSYSIDFTEIQPHVKTWFSVWREFCLAIGKSKNLKIDLSRNRLGEGLGDEALKLLCDAIANSHHLEINLKNNNFNAEQTKKILAALKKAHHPVIHLTLSSECEQEVGAALQSSRYLTINLDGQSASSYVAAIKKSSGLTVRATMQLFSQAKNFFDLCVSSESSLEKPTVELDLNLISVWQLADQEKFYRLIATDLPVQILLTGIFNEITAKIWARICEVVKTAKRVAIRIGQIRLHSDDKDPWFQDSNGEQLKITSEAFTQLQEAVCYSQIPSLPILNQQQNALVNQGLLAYGRLTVVHALAQHDLPKEISEVVLNLKESAKPESPASLVFYRIMRQLAHLKTQLEKVLLPRAKMIFITDLVTKLSIVKTLPPTKVDSELSIVSVASTIAKVHTALTAAAQQLPHKPIQHFYTALAEQLDEVREKISNVPESSSKILIKTHIRSASYPPVHGERKQAEDVRNRCRMQAGTEINSTSVISSFSGRSY